jgi:hypothetical protein
MLRLLLGIKRRYEFRDNWTTFFSPVYSIYDHWFEDPLTGATGMVNWRLFIFFVPVTGSETRLITLAYTKSRYPGPAGCVRPFKWLMRKKLDQEIRLDVRILENLVDYDTSIEGMKLSRFDKVLGLNRERIARIYRGEAEGIPASEFHTADEKPAAECQECAKAKEKEANDSSTLPLPAPSA